MYTRPLEGSKGPIFQKMEHGFELGEGISENALVIVNTSSALRLMTHEFQHALYS
jgi:hypothetical protein